MPTWQNIDVLQSLESAIKDLADFTDTLSGEDWVTFSSLKGSASPKFLAESSTDTALTKDIKCGY